MNAVLSAKRAGRESLCLAITTNTCCPELRYANPPRSWTSSPGCGLVRWRRMRSAASKRQSASSSISSSGERRNEPMKVEFTEEMKRHVCIADPDWRSTGCDEAALSENRRWGGKKLCRVGIRRFGVDCTAMFQGRGYNPEVYIGGIYKLTVTRDGHAYDFQWYKYESGVNK